MADTEHTDAELVQGYLQCIREGRSETPHWAFEEVVDLIGSNPERLWLLTLDMLRQADTPVLVATVAAGPLEDLLCYHGEHFIERVEALARAEPWFLDALRSVWGHIRMPPEVYSRVQQAIRGNA